MMRGIGWVPLAALAAVALVISVQAQTAISTDGVIESKSGGFKFPDGSIQTTATGSTDPCPTLDPADEMILVGGVCIDKYEASVWSQPDGGTQYGLDLDGNGEIDPGSEYPCDANGQDCADVGKEIYARSVPGVPPSRFVTWFQAQAALANSGKRLPTNAEWQMAVLGTPDPGEDPGSEDCHVGSSPDAPEDTGERENCVSRWGHHDMVGNLWEWVADWVPLSTDCPGWGSFSDDIMCLSGAATTEEFPGLEFPGALDRGGSWNSSSSAGPFAVSGLAWPSASNFGVGFRGAR